MKGGGGVEQDSRSTKQGEQKRLREGQMLKFLNTKEFNFDCIHKH